nr:MAG TPA: hypothetical protein [Bacteriophage sp.]
MGRQVNEYYNPNQRKCQSMLFYVVIRVIR